MQNATDAQVFAEIEAERINFNNLGDVINNFGHESKNLRKNT